MFGIYLPNRNRILKPTNELLVATTQGTFKGPDIGTHVYFSTNIIREVTALSILDNASKGIKIAFGALPYQAVDLETSLHDLAEMRERGGSRSFEPIMIVRDNRTSWNFIYDRSDWADEQRPYGRILGRISELIAPKEK